MIIYKNKAHYLLILLFCIGLPARSVPQSNLYPESHWLTESRAITSLLTEEAKSIDSLIGVLLWARLGEIWWEYDKVKARSWLSKAVDELEQNSDKITSDESVYRKSIARLVLSIVAAKDSSLSERLTTFLTSNVGKDLDQDNDRNAETLIRVASGLVDTNPQHAANLGATSLRLGRTGYFSGYFRKLYAKDTKLAEPLFEQALTIAFAKKDKFLFEILLHSAYPNYSSINPSIKATLPDRICAKILGAVVQFSQRLDAEAPFASCNFILNNLTSLISEYHRLLPQQAALVTEIGLRCKTATNNNSLSQIKASEAFDKENLESIDDLLAAAKNKTDSTQKIILTFRAIEKARQEKQLARAIEILDSLSEKERQVNVSYWKTVRAEFAASLAYESLKVWDLAPMRKVINDTPADLQPIVLLRVVQLTSADQPRTVPNKESNESGTKNKASETKGEDASASYNRNRQIAIDFLREAKSELPKIQLTNQEREQLYLVLIDLYTKLERSEALPALREAVTEINRSHKDQWKSNTQLGDLKSEVQEALQPMRLPFTLIEENYQDLSLAVSSVKDDLVRVKMRLGLLDSLLKASNKPNMKQGKETEKRIQ